MYLLDTNHCYHFLKKHASILQKIFQLGDDSLVVTCVIVQGELVYMAQKSERKEENLHELEQFLEHMAVYPVDRETADIYGMFQKTVDTSLIQDAKFKMQDAVES